MKPYDRNKYLRGLNQIKEYLNEQNRKLKVLNKICQDSIDNSIKIKEDSKNVIEKKFFINNIIILFLLYFIICIYICFFFFNK